jgi:hypothetical protein
MSKTLIFEGAGWEKAESGIKSGVGNCRIRTRIRKDAGRLIYLEILGFEYQGKKPIWAENYSIAGWVDACFYDDSKWDANRNRSKDFRSLTRVKFEYNKENILKLVNENLNCSFDEVQVINDNSVRVFDTEQPLCSSTDKEFPPHKDIEINIDQLESVDQLQNGIDSNRQTTKLVITV